MVNIDSVEYGRQYLPWLSLIASIPKNWLNILRDNQNNHEFRHGIENYVPCIDGTVNTIHVKSRDVYRYLVRVISECSTAECKFNLKYCNDEEMCWKDVCQLPFRTTIDVKIRHFQYKILHNFLTVNYMLHKWKIVDSNRCSLCFIESETVSHLFCQCCKSITLYEQIRTWCNSYDVHLPHLNEKEILYGIIPWTKHNCLANHLILLYKQFLFKNKEFVNKLTLLNFQVDVKLTETIERKIATK